MWNKNKSCAVLENVLVGLVKITRRKCGKISLGGVQQFGKYHVRR